MVNEKETLVTEFLVALKVILVSIRSNNVALILTFLDASKATTKPLVIGFTIAAQTQSQL